MVLLNADQPTPSPSASARTSTSSTQPQPSSFLEIPASMMEKMLDKTNEVGALIHDSINGIRNNRARFREDLKGSINRPYDDDKYSAIKCQFIYPNAQLMQKKGLDVKVYYCLLLVLVPNP